MKAFSNLRSLNIDADILEVGSTAVEGVVGKQDIDILVHADQIRFETILTVLDQHYERDLDQLSNDSYQGYVVETPLDISI